MHPFPTLEFGHNATSIRNAIALGEFRRFLSIANILSIACIIGHGLSSFLGNISQVYSGLAHDLTNKSGSITLVVLRTLTLPLPSILSKCESVLHDSVMQ